MAIKRFDNFGGGACIPIAAATITAAAGNNNLVCEDQTFTVSYLPLTATAPITYLWSTDGLQSGQGTATAVYQWTATCSKTITCTVSNACGAAVATYTLSVDLTLAQICNAIETTLSSNMTAANLTRAYGYDEIPEGVNDAPSLMVYWQSIVNDVFTSTDRLTFKGGVKEKELNFHVDYIVNPLNNLAENNALLTRGANEIIDILEQESLGCTAGAHCPPFSLCALKNFRWSGERVTFDYGGVIYYGARFIITIRVF